MTIASGIYKHFKGNKYYIHDICYDRDNKYVLYQALYGERDFWIRDYSMFNETINLEGKIIKRFELIKRSKKDITVDFMEVFHSEILEKINIKLIDGVWLVLQILE